MSSNNTLRIWVKASTEPDNALSRKLAELKAENRRLKKELDDTKDIVETFKKSVAIFIKPWK